MFLSRLLVLSLGSSFAAAVSPLVDVGYTKYLGTSLPNGVSQWLGVRFAAPPLGNLRFKAPVAPLRNNTVQVADAHGPTCLATNNPFPFAGTDEDCLFLDVYAPSHATANSKLPVYFFIQGGGFVNNANANYNGSGLITASDMNVVVVNFNYRVGIFGFLASKELQEENALNLGLLDQRMAMQWVQEHISKFGGDPNHVTVGGDSAGGMSILVHLTAFGGAPTNLFHAVASESAGFFTQLTVPQSQFLYDNIVNLVGCNNHTHTVECLRQTPVETLQIANRDIPYVGRPAPPLFIYMPVIDGVMIQDFLHRSFSEGKFLKIPAIFGDDTNEGTIFAPMNLNTTEDMDTWLVDQFPFLTPAMVTQINKMYPEGQQFPGIAGPFFTATSAAYADLFYMCTGLFASSQIAKFRNPQPNWTYRYNVEDPAQVAMGLGVPHTVEVNSIWGPTNTQGGAPASYLPGGVNAAIVPVMQGYWTSFIRTFDPNVHRAPGSAFWEPHGTSSQERRIVFQTNATAVETVSADQESKCAFFKSIALQAQQ